jgi:Holliday junction resolvase-like predicted endonuclease
MLTENDVIEAVVSHLKHRGWAILSTCSTGRHGIDILAEKGGKKLAVEAKGGTSATLATKRYGKPFTANQKRTHAAVALLTAAQVASDGEFSAGVAFPNDSEHIKLITRILPALRTLEIQVFLIGQDLKICDLTSKAV